METQSEPKTLLEAVRYFSDADNCDRFMEKVRWPDGQPCCPKCGNVEVGRIKSRRAYQCKAKECRKQFTLKLGTIFEDSALGFDKWLPAVWSITNAKNGISSCELARAVGVTQKSAWHMLHRIRLAMQTKSFAKITGEVESDETFFGGLVKNMHSARKKKVLAEWGNKGKIPIHGMLQRGGEIRVKVVKSATAPQVLPHIHENIEKGATVYTDIAALYRSLGRDFQHYAVNHAIRYVDGRIHTNGLENFWSLFKRMARGTYVNLSVQHLQRYLDEQARRFNMRKLKDGERFQEVIRSVVGKRLTYRELTDGEAQTA